MHFSGIASASLGLLFSCLRFTATVGNDVINGPRCGRSAPLPRISNGSPIIRKQIPWIVNLYAVRIYLDANNVGELCGGSIITRNFVLTAGHCVYLKAPPDDDLYIEVYYNHTYKGKGPVVTVKKVFLHPDYLDDPQECANDVALLQLSRPLDFDDYVSPVCLPKSPSRSKEKRLFLAGWGNTKHNSPTSDVLFCTTMEEAPYKECARRISENRRQDFNHSVLICSLSRGNNPCRGDSGGPVTVVKGRGRSVQVGVVSWGGDCGNQNDVEGFAKVSAYVPWIKSIVRNS